MGGAGLWGSGGMALVGSCAKMMRIDVWWWFCLLSTDLFFPISRFYFYSVHLRDYFPPPRSPYTLLSPARRRPGQSSLRRCSSEKLKAVCTRQPRRPSLCWCMKSRDIPWGWASSQCHHRHHCLWLISEQRNTTYLFYFFGK